MDSELRYDAKRHDGRIAVVTGAASGIGRAAVKRLVAEGASVVACDIDEDRLASLRQACGDSKLTVVLADITDEVDIARIASVADSVGSASLLANVAGIGDEMLPVGEIDDTTWTRVLEVNLTGPMRLCRALMPTMRRARGAIINVSSIAGLSGGGGGAAYTASKHGLIGLTRSIAYLYGPDGVRCNAVCPGGVLSRIGRTASPAVPWVAERMKVSLARNPGFVDGDHIAALISWLGSDEAVNVNGAIVTSDGGWLSA